MTEIRTTSSTGGQKGVKPEAYHLIPPAALAEVARVYGYGAEKYDDHNWRRGYDFSKSYSALQRHLNAFWEGTDDDEESGRAHLGHAAFHILALLEWTVGPDADRYAEFDDRYEQDVEEEGTGEVCIAPLGTPFQAGEWTEVGYVDETEVAWGNPTPRSLELTSESAGVLRKLFFPNVRFEASEGGLMSFVANPAPVEARPGYNGIWGVGDTVRLSAGGLLTRQLGGGWLLSELPGYPPETSWTDRRITDLANGRGDDYSMSTRLVQVVAQKRPWRGSGEWSEGDRVTIWESPGGLAHAVSYDGSGWRTTCCGYDEVAHETWIHDVINGKASDLELNEIIFADGSQHGPSYIAGLEEAAAERAKPPRDPFNGVGDWKVGDVVVLEPSDEGVRERHPEWVTTSTRWANGWSQSGPWALANDFTQSVLDGQISSWRVRHTTLV